MNWLFWIGFGIVMFRLGVLEGRLRREQLAHQSTLRDLAREREKTALVQARLKTPEGRRALLPDGLARFAFDRKPLPPDVTEAEITEQARAYWRSIGIDFPETS